MKFKTRDYSSRLKDNTQTLDSEPAGQKPCNVSSGVGEESGPEIGSVM